MKQNSLWMRIKAYKLSNQVFITLALFVCSVFSLFIYEIPEVNEHPVLSIIFLTLFASLLVTVFTNMVDIYVNYDHHKRDTFLEDIEGFGIINLYSNKTGIVRDMIKNCEGKIWFCGYRMILMDELKFDIQDAIKKDQNISITAVLCPPWSKTYKLIYGEDTTIQNYRHVFNAIVQGCRKEEGIDLDRLKNIKIYFVDKPIFNDTYLVDKNLLTGSFMNNKDPYYNRLSAKDFFSFSVKPKSKLYELVLDECRTLEEEAYCSLNWGKYIAMEENLTKDDSDWSIIEKTVSCLDVRPK